MVVRHRTKSTRSLGYNCHTGLRRRGAGNRGGVGKAGHGKRAKQKKFMYMVDGAVDYGKHGFTSKKAKIKTITLGYLSDHASELCETKAGKYYADIRALGFDKVLGSGAVNKPLIVSGVGSITEKAKAKIVKAGGEVINNESE